MSALQWFLTVWYIFSTHLYYVFTPGFAGGGHVALYEGSGPEALAVAEQIGGSVVSVTTHLQVWPGPWTSLA